MKLFHVFVRFKIYISDDNKQILPGCHMEVEMQEA